MAEIDPRTPVHLFGEAFRKALNDVLSPTLGSPCNVSMSEATESAVGAGSLLFGITAAGSLRGKAMLVLKNAEALTLSAKLLSETADPAGELNAARKQAIEGVLNQVVAQAATALTMLCGETVLQLAPVETPISSSATAILSLPDTPVGPITVTLALDSELLASVSARTSPSAATPEPLPTDSNLDLLLGVDLNLTLRFGQRTLTLREIMDLSSGSIIELDRQVQEPADLLLGDKLIARGEVVIVDGNYGLRITEVADPQPGMDRLALGAH